MSSLDPDERGLVAPRAAEWCERFLDASPAGRRWARRARSAPSRRVARRLERWLLPGIFCHYQCRKRVIEARWERFRADGGTQLLIIGAGFDSLGVRVAQATPTVRVIELDHPNTQGAKRSVVEGIANLTLIPADLGTVLPSEAWGTTIDRSRPTFIILEGLLMYLTPSQVHDLWIDLRSLRLPRASMLFTFMEPDAAGRPGFRPQSWLADAWLKWKGEPMHSCFARRDLESVLNKAGWALREYLDGHSMAREAGIATNRTILGESIAVTSFGAEVSEPIT